MATIESIPELEARTKKMLATISRIPASIAGTRPPLCMTSGSRLDLMAHGCQKVQDFSDFRFDFPFSHFPSR